MTRIGVAACVWLALMVEPARAAAEKQEPLDVIESMRRSLIRPVISGTLQEALAQYRKLVGVRVEADWESLRQNGVKKADKVTLKVPRATGEQLLDLMLAQIARKGHPLAWYIDGQIVRLTGQLRVLYRNRLPFRTGRARPGREVARRGIGRINLDFDRTPLEEVIAYLREISNLNMHVRWRSLELIGIGRQTKVTMNISRITLPRALTLVTRSLSASPAKLERVYWVVDDGVVVIASGASVNTRLRTRIYDVSDLLVVVPNFKAPEVELGSQETADQGSAGGLFGQAGRETDEAESPAARRQRLEENLIAAIKDSIGQDMWQPIGPGSIRLLDGKLIISQTPLGFKLLGESARRR